MDRPSVSSTTASPSGVATTTSPPRASSSRLSGSSARLIRDPETLRDDLAYNMSRVVDWQATLVTAYERGVRLHLELPPGGVLTGLARRVFDAGQAIAFEGARLDTLDAMLRQEVSRDR